MSAASIFQYVRIFGSKGAPPRPALRLILLVLPFWNVHSRCLRGWRHAHYFSSPCFASSRSLLALKWSASHLALRISCLPLLYSPLFFLKVLKYAFGHESRRQGDYRRKNTSKIDIPVTRIQRKMSLTRIRSQIQKK